MSKKIIVLSVTVLMALLFVLSGCQQSGNNSGETTTGEAAVTTASQENSTGENTATPENTSAKPVEEKEDTFAPETHAQVVSPEEEETQPKSQSGDKAEQTTSAKPSEKPETEAQTEAETTMEDVPENPIAEGEGVVLPDDDWF